MENKDDMVVKPKHYTKYGKYEPITVLTAWGCDFLTGSAIKYIARSYGDDPKVYDGMTELDSRLRDIDKAIRCLQMKANSLRGEDVL